MTWNVKWHETPNDMKRQMTWNAKWHETPNDMKCQMTWNAKWHETPNYMKCQKMLMLMLDLWPQAETPGVTHFGAYHRPLDGHFFNLYITMYNTHQQSGGSFYSELALLKYKLALHWENAMKKFIFRWVSIFSPSLENITLMAQWVGWLAIVSSTSRVSSR